MKSKGKQMRKFSTFKEAAQKIVIKKPWGVEIKSYKAGDPIPAGVEFKIFNATDTDKIEAYADGLDESADYQKKRFKEPAYMYESVSKKNIKSADDLYEWLTEYMRKHSSNRFTTLQIILGNGNNITFAWDMKAYKGIHEGDKDYTMSEFVYKFMDPVIKNSGISDIWEVDMNTGRFKPTKESFVIQDSDSNNKPVYFHYGKYTGYDWGFDKNGATKFSTKEAAERMLEKMRQEGMLINSMKVVSESVITESKKVVENKMVGIISLPVGAKFIDDSFGGKRTLEVVKHGNDDVVHVKEVGTGRKFAYDASTPGGNKKVEKIEEGFLITGPSIEGKTFYVRSKDGQGTTFDRSNAFIFNSEKDAKDTVEKMKKAGYYTDKIEVIKESLSSKTHKFKPEELKVGKRVIDKVGGHEVHGKITVNHHDLYKDNPYTQDKKGSTVVTITTDSGRSYDVDANDNGGEFILESRIAKGYENLNADERAKHLLSHPSSKYMNDLKSENITERAIRKAVKEMLGKPDKRDPQFITDVNEGCIKESAFYVKFSQDGKSSKYYMYNNGKHGFTDDKSKATKFSTKEEAEKTFKKNPYYDAFNMKYFDIVSEEGEAPAIANTTAEVANPELPLKLKESNSWTMGDGTKMEVKGDKVFKTTPDGKKFWMSRSAWEHLADDDGDIENGPSFHEPRWIPAKEDLESDKAEALADYKKAKAEYLANKSDENWKNYIEKKNVCMALGVRI